MTTEAQPKLNFDLLSDIKDGKILSNVEIHGNRYNRNYDPSDDRFSTNINADDLGTTDNISIMTTEEAEAKFGKSDKKNVPKDIPLKSQSERKNFFIEKFLEKYHYRDYQDSIQSNETVVLSEGVEIKIPTNTKYEDIEGIPYQIVKRRRSSNMPIEFFDGAEITDMAKIAKKYLEENLFAKGITRSEVCTLLNERFSEDMATTISRLEHKGQMSLMTLERIASLNGEYLNLAVWKTDEPDIELERVDDINGYPIKEISKMARSNQPIEIEDSGNLMGMVFIDLLNHVIFPAGITRDEISKKLRETYPEEVNIPNIFNLACRKGQITYSSVKKILTPLGFSSKIYFLKK